MLPCNLFHKLQPCSLHYLYTTASARPLPACLYQIRDMQSAALPTAIGIQSRGMFLLVGVVGLTRPFLFVPYGQNVPESIAHSSISCDGKVPGTPVDLTHWKDGYSTPDELYADTSTEIALNMARARLERREFQHLDDYTIVNNHVRVLRIDPSTSGCRAHFAVQACIQEDTCSSSSSLSHS